jgi:DNA-binding NarL/FixJ family response regulator
MERTILLLDGHDGVRAALAARLRHTNGVGMVEATGDLADALCMVKATAPDAVIYDPHTVRASADEAIPRLAGGVRPVIVLTSSLVGDEAAALTRAGATALLLKGSNVTCLWRQIEQAIEDQARQVSL